MGVVALQVVNEDRHLIVGSSLQVAPAVCRPAVLARHMAVIPHTVGRGQLGRLAVLAARSCFSQAALAAQVAHLDLEVRAVLLLRQLGHLAVSLEACLDLARNPLQPSQAVLHLVLAAVEGAELRNPLPSGPTQVYA